MGIEFSVMFTCPSCGNAVQVNGEGAMGKEQECPGGCKAQFKVWAEVSQPIDLPGASPPPPAEPPAPSPNPPEESTPSAPPADPPVPLGG